jgi:hypothetical protein
MELKCNGSDSECDIDRYCIQCVLDLAVVKLLLVRTPHIGNTIFDGLTVCRSTSW